MVLSISSDDPNALEKLKAKIEVLENERKSMREFNIQARRNKTKPIEYKELVKKKNLSLWYKKRIKYLEEVKTYKKNGFTINGIKVIENYDEQKVEFHFQEQPNYKAIKILTDKAYTFNSKKNCWEKNLNKNYTEHLNILKLI